MLDRDLLTELQYALIEPPDGGDTWPSLIWTRQEVLDAVDGGLQRLARDTHYHLARVEIAVPAGTLRIALPADWIATASVVWRDAATLARTPLGPADSFEADLALPGPPVGLPLDEPPPGGYETMPGLPIAYIDMDGETLTFRLAPTPGSDGVIELLYVHTPAHVTGSAPGTELPCLDELVSAVKYDALAWLLRKMGRLLDAERANYCERRYQLAQTVAGIILDGWA